MASVLVFVAVAAWAAAATAAVTDARSGRISKRVVWSAAGVGLAALGAAAGLLGEPRRLGFAVLGAVRETGHTRWIDPRELSHPCIRNGARRPRTEVHA